MRNVKSRHAAKSAQPSRLTRDYTEIVDSEAGALIVMAEHMTQNWDDDDASAVAEQKAAREHDRMLLAQDLNTVGASANIMAGKFAEYARLMVLDEGMATVHQWKAHPSRQSCFWPVNNFGLSPLMPLGSRFWKSSLLLLSGMCPSGHQCFSRPGRRKVAECAARYLPQHHYSTLSKT